MEQRSAIEELLARARASLDRVEPDHLADEVARSDPNTYSVLTPEVDMLTIMV